MSKCGGSASVTKSTSRCLSSSAIDVTAHGYFRSTIISFSHGSFKIRCLLTLLHTPLSEFGKVESTSSYLG